MMRVFPFLQWLPGYRKSDLPGDVIAGFTVAIMLIPQGMAYAILAGLPPEVGLYAGILPVLVYGLLGSTHILTLGPTAITSIMVLSSIENLAEPGSEQYTYYAMTLALCLGAVYLLMGLFRLGFIVNILSEPVLVGYINAAALVIIFSQLQYFLGISIPHVSSAYEMIWETIKRLDNVNLTTFTIGMSGTAVIVYFRVYLGKHLDRLSVHATVNFLITRSGPLFVVALGILAIFVFRLDESAGVATIGEIPFGLPPISVDKFDFTHLDTLLVGALAIAFVGFMEGISTVKSLASRSHQRISANQELVAMGAANVAAAISGGYPVTTSISRSAVNYTAGAKTGLSSVIAALLIAITVVFVAPLFHYLPSVALAVIVITSVLGLVDFSSVRQLWRYSPVETIPFGITFVAVLMVNIEIGIFIGVASSIGLHLLKTSRPAIVRLGRYGDSEHYEDTAWYQTNAIPYVEIVRIDESLYFANVQFLDKRLRNILVESPETQYLILVCTSVNNIDASALQVLTLLVDELHGIGVEVYFADIKARVLARLQAVHFVGQVGRHRFFNTTHEAVLSTGYLTDDLNPG